MDTLIKPTEHVEEIFGKKPILVYGDVIQDDIVLYSNSNFPTYEANGDIYMRYIDLNSTLKDKLKYILTSGRAYIYPNKKVVMKPPRFELEKYIENEPSEELRRIFGINTSFGYIPSMKLLNYFFPDVETGLNIISSDIALSHEGAHVVSVKKIYELASEYFDLISNHITDREIKEQVLFETVSFFEEFKYIEKLNPKIISLYKRFRANERHIEYLEANRILFEEHERVEEMINKIKEINFKEKD